MAAARRYQIFISSTFNDLQDHRKALISQILKLGHIPAGMELFSAGNENEFDVIKRAIDQSDLYVVLIGATYGSVKEGTSPPKSYTQLEFEYARDIAEKPCMVFVLEEKEFLRMRRVIEQKKKEDCQHTARLRSFREEASKGRIVEQFSRKEPYELVAKFQTALLSILGSSSDQLMGYVHASVLDDIQKQVRLLGIVGQTEIMRDIVIQLNRYDKLASRMNEQQVLKRSLAVYFWRRFAAPIFNSGYRDLFFESGSTLAYLSLELLALLNNNEAMLVTTNEAEDRVRIRTNNILTYLSYVLLSRIKTSLVPYGPPDTKYGATYGEIALHFSDDIAPAPSRVRNKGIPDKELKIIEQIRKDALTKGDSTSHERLFLAAASGLELMNKDPLCQGPHVGTYRNMLLKRAIYDTGSPVILFLDETKIDRNFSSNRCYSVMTKGKTWMDVCAESSIAICYASASREGFDSIADKLIKHSFIAAENEPESLCNEQSIATYCGLFANKNFYAQFDEPIKI